jgi:hypothetical protein
MSMADEVRAIVRAELAAAVAEIKAALAPQASAAPALLTVADVARSCQTREKTVLTWIAAGRLAARKAGRKWVVVPADLERFLASETAAAPASDDAAVVRILSRRRSSNG